MSRRGHRVTTGALIAAALGVAAGCNARSGVEPVSGSVTLDGSPLDEAVVVFVPVDRKAGQRGGAIVAGRFALAGDDGLVPGRYRVEFYDEPAPAFGPAERRSPPARSVSIPSRYNRQSERTIEIRGGETNAFDFALRTTGSP